MKKLVIIGSGVIGTTHAIKAAEAGMEVMVIEKHARPMGASVRNFGAVWPIGCAIGEEREQALYGAGEWKKYAQKTGFWHRVGGSLSLAYREEAWQVLQEFSAAADGEGFQLLGAEEVAKRYSAVNARDLKGALWSASEIQVESAQALSCLQDYAASIGVVFHFNTLAVRLEEAAVHAHDGVVFNYDELLIAAGEEMQLFFPEEMAQAEIWPCRLQMHRTVPQVPDFQLNSIMVSDLTLCHYPAFAACPSQPLLRRRLEMECSEEQKWGVHVIASQWRDGSLVIGDSHEYGADLDVALRDEIEQLILKNLRSFVNVPELKIERRWQGTYLKSKKGLTQVVLRPRSKVTMVTAMGGLGMTLSWGLAQKHTEHWIS